MKKEISFDVILAAGGSGSRFGSDKNKLLLPLRGKAVFLYSLRLFGVYPGVRRLVIPCRQADREEIASLVSQWQEEGMAEKTHIPEILLTEGGRERQDSVYRALQLCREDLVLIHDAARPFATEQMIQDCLKALENYPAVTAGVVSKDTVKLVNEKDEVVKTLERQFTRLIQTPQGFHRRALQAAHEAYGKIAVTDDCALMELAGHPVIIIPGSYENIKITTPEDLAPG